MAKSDDFTGDFIEQPTDDYKHEIELDLLPLRATVAFAERCIRRVRPLYDQYLDFCKYVDQSIDIATKFALGHVTTLDATNLARYSLGKAQVFHGELSELSLSSDNSLQSAHSALVAIYLAKIALEFAETVYEAAESNYLASKAKDTYDDDGDSLAIDAVNSAHNVSRGLLSVARLLADKSPESALQASINASQVTVATHGDLSALTALKLGPSGTLGLPVDPSESGPLGPLWPVEEPEWIRKAKTRVTGRERTRSTQPSDDTPDIVIVWDPGVLNDRRYAEIVSLLGDLARAEGGLGIERIRSLGIGLPEGAGVVR